MKKTAIISLSLLTAFGAFAQARLNAGALQMLSAARAANAPAARSGEWKYVEEVKFDRANFFVTVDDEADFETLKAEGYNIQAVNGDMAVINLDAQELLSLSEHPLVAKISSAEEANALLVDARVATGVDAVHQGTDLPKAYTGKGVVLGMMDVGLDVNHVNFLKDVNETGYFTKNPGKDIPSRIERLWWISGKGVVQEFKTPEAIAGFDTDNAEQTHGTHVLGIAAGSFRGRVSAPIINDRGANDSRPKANPFYGVAYEADLAVAAGTLDGTNINIAIKNISEYAQSVNKPVVMNLSLGHNLGPHDGSTDANKWMSGFVDKNLIICVSAGNEGDLPIAIDSQLSPGNTTIRTFLSKNATANGTWDLWSGNSDKFNTTFAVYDTQEGEVVWTHKVDYTKLDNTNRVVVCGTYYTMPTYDVQTKMDDFFGTHSVVTFTPVVDANNNRFNVRVYCDISPDNTAKGKRYIPALIIDGASGQRISMYGNSTTAFYSNGIAGFTEGSTNGSINDMACAEGVIAVGAYTNKVTWPLNGNNKGTFGYNIGSPGAIAYFSSYGKTFSGESLPHITAPGMGMISSMSNYYYNTLKAGDPDYDYMVFSLDEGTKRKRKSYWVEMSGTSMAAPFVTGVMALWLEANPDLTPAEAKKILMETATKDQYTNFEPERWGAGKVNALEGLKKVLGLSSGINEVAADGRDILINQVGSNDYDLFCPGASEIRAELFNVAGQMVAADIAKGDNLTFTPAADHGIYILRVTAGNKTATQKITIR